MTWVTRVNPIHVPAVWPYCVEYTANALEYGHGEMELSDVYGMLLSGTWHLWTVIDGSVVAAATTEFAVYPRMSALRVVTLGGTGMRSWLPLLTEAWESYARRCGCKRIEAAGRPGWTRVMRKSGYIDGMRLTVKDLDDGQE